MVAMDTGELIGQVLFDADPSAVTNAMRFSIPSTPAVLVPFQEDLLAAADASPKEFHDVFARLAQAVIALSASNIPPPRTVGELAKMSDMFRKASGLDGVHPGKGCGFFPHMPILRRGSVPVVDVEEVAEDPLEGFEI